MKRIGFIFLGVSLALTVTVSASATRHDANATGVQKAEQCIRAALRKESLALKYHNEGSISEKSIAETVLGPALNDLTCAINATRAASSLDQISQDESASVRSYLREALDTDTRQRNSGLISVLYLRSANEDKESALATLEKATAPPSAPSPAAPSWLGLNGDKLELAFTNRTFVNCAANLQSQVASTFTASYVIAADPGATGAPVNLTLTPGANSLFGVYEDGTVPENGLIQVKGTSAYIDLSLTIQLPSTILASNSPATEPVTGTALVESHLAGGANCTSSWKLDATNSTVSRP